MNLKVVRTLSEINRIKSNWYKLFEDNSGFSIFEHFEWVYNYYSGIDEKNILLIVIYDETNNLVGIFPFAISILKIKKMKFTCLVHATGNLSDYSSFLLSKTVNRKIAVERVVEKLVELQDESWEFYHINKLSNADDLAKLFRFYLSEHIYGKCLAGNITLCISYDNIFGERKKISNVTRRFNKLNDSSKVEVILDVTPDINTIEEIRYLQKKQFPGVGFSTSNTISFFNKLISNNNFNKYISVSYIRANGELIAGHFGYKHNGKAYYYVPAYNQKFSEYGPGQFLLLSMINYYKDKGYTEFDFLRGVESYKKHWANTINTNFVIFGVSKKSGFLHKSLVNLWLLTKSIPFFFYASK